MTVISKDFKCIHTPVILLLQNPFLPILSRPSFKSFMSGPQGNSWLFWSNGD